MSSFYDQLHDICSKRGSVKGLAQGDPISVILGVLAGIDFFETDYPLDLASKGKALILDPRWPKQSSEPLLNFKSKVVSGLAQNEALMLAVACENRIPKTVDILSQPENRFSSEPLQRGCGCYCCKNYTRAYLYHLFDVNEMNANILLAIHNAYTFD